MRQGISAPILQNELTENFDSLILNMFADQVPPSLGR